MGNLDDAMGAYERALRHNPQSIPAMTAISCVLRTREEFQKAAEYLQAILRLDETNGEAWGNLGMLTIKRLSLDLVLTLRAGHCFLMMDDLQQAYNAYQNALVHLPSPKVSSCKCYLALQDAYTYCLGSSPVVWHRYPLRSVWFSGPCRGGVRQRHGHGPRF